MHLLESSLPKYGRQLILGNAQEEIHQIRSDFQGDVTPVYQLLSAVTCIPGDEKNGLKVFRLSFAHKRLSQQKHSGLNQSAEIMAYFINQHKCQKNPTTEEDGTLARQAWEMVEKAVEELYPNTESTQTTSVRRSPVDCQLTGLVISLRPVEQDLAIQLKLRQH